MRNTQKDTFVSTTSNITNWSSIDWKKAEKYVDKIQKRIYRAESEVDKLNLIIQINVCLSPLWWKSHDGFLGEKEGATPLTYPTDELHCKGRVFYIIMGAGFFFYFFMLVLNVKWYFFLSWYTFFSRMNYFFFYIFLILDYHLFFMFCWDYFSNALGIFLYMVYG